MKITAVQLFGLSQEHITKNIHGGERTRFRAHHVRHSFLGVIGKFGPSLCLALFCQKSKALHREKSSPELSAINKNDLHFANLLFDADQRSAVMAL